MKYLGLVLMVIAIVSLCIWIISGLFIERNYTNSIYSYWSLADKSSTIEEKSEYIDKFVESLNSPELIGSHNAIVFTTLDNAFDTNYKALKSLQKRLRDIKTMDIKSFEYQQAINQITAQEQGEAQDMLYNLRGCWYLTFHPSYWNWLMIFPVLILVILFIVSLIIYDNFN